MTALRPHDPRTRVLITGFGPFPGVPVNASARLVAALAERATAAFPQAAFHVAVLPAEWDASPAMLAALLAKHQPQLSLHFGVAREAKGFRIETRAANACRLTDDAAGLRPVADWIVKAGDPFRTTTLPAAAITARLTALGIPATVSDDAGGYLCNAILYHALQHAEAAEGGVRTGFIHIPADLSGPPLTFEQALAGALEIVRVCLAEAPPHEHAGTLRFPSPSTGRG